jgi:hypothetical protein
VADQAHDRRDDAVRRDDDDLEVAAVLGDEDVAGRETTRLSTPVSGASSPSAFAS